jgi:hypothetical protein
MKYKVVEQNWDKNHDLLSQLAMSCLQLNQYALEYRMVLKSLKKYFTGKKLMNYEERWLLLLLFLLQNPWNHFPVAELQGCWIKLKQNPRFDASAGEELPSSESVWTMMWKGFA